MFKSYQSRPVIREAYEITEDDQLTIVESGIVEIKTPCIGTFRFTASQTVLVGDFIVHLSEEDVYHCPGSVFRKGNIVD